MPCASARFSSGVVDSRSPEAASGRSVRVMASVKWRSSVKISNPSGCAPNQSDVFPCAVRSALRRRHTPATWLVMIGSPGLLLEPLARLGCSPAAGAGRALLLCVSTPGCHRKIHVRNETIASISCKIRMARLVV